MKIERIIQFFFMVDVMMILGSFYKTDVFNIKVTGILVGVGVALLILLWLVTSIKSNKSQKESQEDKGKSKLKKIKIFLILSILLSGLSGGSYLYFNSLSLNINIPAIPSYCIEPCSPSADACSDETLSLIHI